MGMTMTQKILARAAGLEQVQAGQLIEAQLDLVLGNDITSPVAIKEMDKMKVQGCLIRIRSHWYRIILFPIRILSLRSTANVSASSQDAMRSPITLKWERWESSMPASGERTYRSRRCDHRCGFPYLYLWRSGCIFHRCGKYRYGSRVWLPARHGSKYLRRSDSI